MLLIICPCCFTSASDGLRNSQPQVTDSSNLCGCKGTKNFWNMQGKEVFLDKRAQKKRPYNFFTRENFQRIGFEACFFLCNPATSSLPWAGM